MNRFKDTVRNQLWYFQIGMVLNSIFKKPCKISKVMSVKSVVVWQLTLGRCNKRRTADIRFYFCKNIIFNDKSNYFLRYRNSIKHETTLLHTYAMYWTNFWQPTVRVQQNIFEKTFIKVGSSHLYASFDTFCV